MHGIFFHYFRGNGHLNCQGALSQSEFDDLLRCITERYRVIDAEQFCKEIDRGNDDKNTVCLCFSCGLKSQYDVALPVLEYRRIKAFWMLYSQMLTGQDVLIEIYHHFRFYSFDSVNDFYNTFFSYVREYLKHTTFSWKRVLIDFEHSNYLSWGKYYTRNDRFFKYLRDVVLKEHYDLIMSKLMMLYGYIPTEHRDKLWINESEIRRLSNDGHVIGLHTHTHPNCICNLAYNDQLYEYSTNKYILEKVTGKSIVSMSHPCNSYNNDTLRVLRQLGIKYGFCANMISHMPNTLEIPSEDHSNLIRAMRSNYI